MSEEIKTNKKIFGYPVYIKKDLPKIKDGDIVLGDLDDLVICTLIDAYVRENKN